MVSLLLLLTNRRTVIPAPSTCLRFPATKHNLPGPLLQSEMLRTDATPCPWPARYVDLASVLQNPQPDREDKPLLPQPLRAVEDTARSSQPQSQSRYHRFRPWPFPDCRWC